MADSALKRIICHLTVYFETNFCFKIEFNESILTWRNRKELFSQKWKQKRLRLSKLFMCGLNVCLNIVFENPRLAPVILCSYQRIWILRKRWNFFKLVTISFISEKRIAHQEFPEKPEITQTVIGKNRWKALMFHAELIWLQLNQYEGTKRWCENLVETEEKTCRWNNIY